MEINKYEVREVSRRVSYWNSLLAEYKKKSETEDADLSSTHSRVLHEVNHASSHSLD